MNKGHICDNEPRRGYETKVFDLSDCCEEKSIPGKGSFPSSFLTVIFPQQATLTETRNLQSDWHNHSCEQIVRSSNNQQKITFLY